MKRTTILLTLLGICVGMVLGGFIGLLGIIIGACGGVGMLIGLILSRPRKPAEAPPTEEPQQE